MEATFIKGTNGNLDYVVINEDNNVIVGIKPVFEVTQVEENEFAIAVGIRLRVVPNGDITNVGHFAKSMFPKYHFSKIDMQRASAYNIALIPTFPPEMPYTNFYKAIKTGGFVKKLDESIDYIFSELSSPKVSKEILHKYVYDKFEIKFNELSSLISGENTQSKSKGKVIPLTKKED